MQGNIFWWNCDFIPNNSSLTCLGTPIIKALFMWKQLFITCKASNSQAHYFGQIQHCTQIKELGSITWIVFPIIGDAIGKLDNLLVELVESLNSWDYSKVMPLVPLWMDFD